MVGNLDTIHRSDILSRWRGIRSKLRIAAAFRPKPQLPHRAVVPTHHSLRAQCVPAACTADAGLHLQGNKFPVKQVERPATVLVAALRPDFEGLTDAALRLVPRLPHVMQPSPAM